ncbi:MAG: energy transducer TonB, partial [Spartobacteria bacterium]|nr:energy transducer TonB [Spartobacteria bacterium]
SAHTVELPPPLPPPEPLPPPRQRHQPQPPKPRLRETRRQRTLQPPALRLDMPIGYVGGDFNVAFDINEAALSDQIHDLIFELGDLDEPPRPLTRLKPIYPPQARMRRLEGWVELEFVVLADGTVDDIQRVAEYPEALFTDSAIRAARQWRFIPGSKDGDAVAVRVRQKVTFKVE